jgi:hypothetical protein
MSLTLPNNVWSPEDLKELTNDLKQYATWLASYGIKQRVSSSSQPTPPPTLSPLAVSMLHELHDRRLLTESGVDKLVADLEAVAVVAPRVHFTFAAAPSNGLKKDFVNWCRENISHDVLVSFSFNATILGGMVVRYGSHIFDWSFRRQILANRAKFPEVLRRV